MFANAMPIASTHDLTPMLSHGVTGGLVAHAPIVPTVPSGPGGNFISFDGSPISGTITGITAHTWVDDTSGLFNTATNLSVEWTGFYQQMIDGHGASLAPTQRLEAEAQATFLATGLAALPGAQQALIRQDVQREIDAIGAAQTIDQTTLGIDPNAPLTAATYLDIVNTIAANPALKELGIQGHGLNSPPMARYGGYTTDVQHNAAINNATLLYVGPGADHNKSALINFMDDAILTHLVFPVIMKNGQLVQLNQNGAKEQNLNGAVNTVNRMMYGKLLAASDFSTTPKN